MKIKTPVLIERVEMSTVHIGDFDTAMFAWQTRLAIFPKDYGSSPMMTSPMMTSLLAVYYAVRADDFGGSQVVIVVVNRY